MPATDQRLAVERGGQRRRPAHHGHRLGRSGGRQGELIAAQQALVHGHGGGARRGAELVAQQDPQLLERAQRLGGIAGRVVHLHQQPVRRLAERGGRDRRAGRLLGGAELAPALMKAGLGQHLERPHAHRLELAPGLVHPRALAVRQEGLEVDGQHLARGAGRGRPVARVDRDLGAHGRGRRRLDVDLDRLLERQPQLRAAGERAFAQGAAELGEQRGERGVGRDGWPLGPQQIDQLAATAVAVTVEDEVREQEPPLPSGQRPTERATSVVHSHRPAQPYRPPRLLSHARPTLSRRQGFSKVSPIGVPHDSGRGDGKCFVVAIATWTLRDT